MQTTNGDSEGVWVFKVMVISVTYIFQVLYILCFTRPNYQVSVYRTIGPLVLVLLQNIDCGSSNMYPQSMIRPKIRKKY